MGIFDFFYDLFCPISMSKIQITAASWSYLLPSSPGTPPIYIDSDYKPTTDGVYPTVTHAHLSLRGFNEDFHFYTQDLPGAEIGSLNRYLNINLKDFWLMSYADLLEQRRPDNEHIAHIYDWNQDDVAYTYCLIFDIGGSTYYLRTSDNNETLARISQYSSERLYYSKVGFGGGARL